MIGAHNYFHPYVILSIYWSALLGYLIITDKFVNFLDGLNHVADQWMAIVVIVVGCVMLVMCKEYGLDSTIAGGIIGVGSNMLQNKLKDAGGQGLRVVPSGPQPAAVATLVPDSVPNVPLVPKQP